MCSRHPGLDVAPIPRGCTGIDSEHRAVDSTANCPITNELVNDVLAAPFRVHSRLSFNWNGGKHGRANHHISLSNLGQTD